MAIRDMAHFLVLLLALSTSSCCNLGLQEKDFEGITRLPVPAGPEDLAMHNHKGRARFIVSCDDRRKEGGRGVLVAIDPETAEVTTLFNPPQSVSFHPHGISLGKYLYVVSHHSDTLTEIYTFRFGRRGNLILNDPPIPLPIGKGTVSPGVPNDLAVLPNGDLILTSPGLFKDRILLFSQTRKQWQVFDDNPPGLFPNGIWVHENWAYIAFSISKNIYRYNLSLPAPAAQPEFVACSIAGADNFGAVDRDPDSLLLVSHRSNLCFLASSLTPAICSSNSIWQLDLNTGALTEIVRNNRRSYPINSASVAVQYKNHLWLGQVFGKNLLRIDTATLERR